MEKTRTDDLYGRIDLSKTHFEVNVAMTTILKPNPAHLRIIYDNYCKFKKFASVTPLHDAMILNDDIEYGRRTLKLKCAAVGTGMFSGDS